MSSSLKKLLSIALTLCLLIAFADFPIPASAAATGQYRGFVEDEEGNRISGVSITIFSATDRYTTTSDGNGDYIFSGIEEGVYYLDAAQPGYLPYFTGGGSVVGATETEEGYLGIIMATPKQFTVSGKVFSSSTGNPVDGYTLLFYSNETGSFHSTTTGTDGKYSIALDQGYLYNRTVDFSDGELITENFYYYDVQLLSSLNPAYEEILVTGILVFDDIDWLDYYVDPIGSSPVPYRVIQDGVSVHSGPDTSSPVVATLSIDAVIMVESNNNGWAMLTNGTYVEAKFLELVNNNANTYIAFPDVNFKAALLALGIGDGTNITPAQAAAVTGDLDIRSSGISDLSGIEYFTSITSLNCSGNNLSTLDVTNLPSLISLQCNNNNINSLNASNLPSLWSLNCSGNKLGSLDLTGLPSLTDLNCSRNSLTALDLSDLTSLAILDCSINSLTSLSVYGMMSKIYCQGNSLATLDVSGLTWLWILHCQNNNLTSLDLSSLTEMSTLYCYNNKLTSLNVSGLTVLGDLICSNNNLTSLDVTGLDGLWRLRCDNNYFANENAVIGHTRGWFGDDFVFYPQKDGVEFIAFPDANFKAALLALGIGNGTNITQAQAAAFTGPLNISNRGIASMTGIEYFTSLTNLDCSKNNLNSLDVSSLTSLRYLDCGNNNLTSLNVSGLSALRGLICNNNKLGSLDASTLTSLEWLYCHNNNLTSLNVSGLRSLDTLHCYNNSLTLLNASGLTSLFDLWCENNNLASLNVSGSTSLSSLVCANNSLTSLDVAGLTMLEYLECHNNKLTSLSLSNLTKLEQLACDKNKLTSLTVSNMPALKILYCEDNNLTSLTLSNLPLLETLYCENNELTSLSVSGLTSIVELNCGGNSLTSLNLSGLNKLARLYCSSNNLSSLNPSGLTSLIHLYCDYNNLTSLNVSGLTKLQQLHCQYNKLPNESAVVGFTGTWDGANYVFYPQKISVVALSPIPGATNVAVASTIQMIFDREIDGIFAIQLKEYDLPNRVIDCDITFACSAQSGFQNEDTIILTPKSALDSNKKYYVEILPGTIYEKGQPSNTFSGVINKDTWSFTTAAASVMNLASYIPRQGNDSDRFPVDTTISLTFDRKWYNSTPTPIQLKKYSTDEVVKLTTQAVTDYGLIMKPEKDLDPGTKYYVEITPNAFYDYSNPSIKFPGITGKDTWSFTTAGESPQAIPRVPIHGPEDSFTYSSNIWSGQKFGDRKLQAQNGEWYDDWHDGADFGYVGWVTPVYPVMPGVVIISDYYESTIGGYGHVVVIWHDPDKGGDGNYSLYGHMSSRAVKQGDYVTQNDRIGVTGGTGAVGWSYGAHLHLTILDKKASDFLPTVPKSPEVEIHKIGMYYTNLFNLATRQTGYSRRGYFIDPIAYLNDGKEDKDKIKDGFNTIITFRCPVEIRVECTNGEYIGEFLDSSMPFHTSPIGTLALIGNPVDPSKQFTLNLYDTNSILLEYKFVFTPTDNGIMEIERCELDFDNQWVVTFTDTVELSLGLNFSSELFEFFARYETYIGGISSSNPPSSDDNNNYDNSTSTTNNGNSVKMLYRVTASRLNVRLGPGQNFFSFDKLAMNTIVEVVETTNDGWAKVLLINGNAGWVSMLYLKPVSFTVTGNQYYTTANLNVRSGPSMQHRILTVLPMGTSIIANEAIIDGFVEIRYGNGIAFIHGKYVTSK